MVYLRRSGTLTRQSGPIIAAEIERRRHAVGRRHLAMAANGGIYMQPNMQSGKVTAKSLQSKTSPGAQGKQLTSLYWHDLPMDTRALVLCGEQQKTPFAASDWVKRGHVNGARMKWEVHEGVFIWVGFGEIAITSLRELESQLPILALAGMTNCSPTQYFVPRDYSKKNKTSRFSCPCGTIESRW